MLARITRNNGADFLEWRTGSGNTVEIFDIAVNSDRRTGIGRDMVNELKEYVKGKTNLIWAMTRPSNIIARQFYENLGFKPIAQLHGFYPDGDSMIYGLHV